MLAQTKLTVKQYYVVGTIRTGKCAYGVESKGNAIGEVNRAIVNWWRGSGFWGINRRIQYHTSRWRNWRGGDECKDAGRDFSGNRRVCGGGVLPTAEAGEGRAGSGSCGDERGAELADSHGNARHGRSYNADACGDLSGQRTHCGRGKWSGVGVHSYWGRYLLAQRRDVVEPRNAEEFVFFRDHLDGAAVLDESEAIHQRGGWIRRVAAMDRGGHQTGAHHKGRLEV